jgi:ligand-binding sensor domain-containing protein
VALALLLTLISSASAQSTSDRQWVVFRQSDGLASNDVFSILVQDDAVWIGTASGVSRYNGRWESFISIIPADATLSAAVSLGAVTALAAGNTEGEVWAGDAAGLLVHWRDGAGWAVVEALNTPIHALVAGDGQLWIGTERGLFLWRNEILTPVEAVGKTPVLTLAYMDGVVWAGAEQALWQVTSNLSEARMLSLIDAQGAPVKGPFTGLWIYSPDHIWFSTATTVFEYSAETEKTTEYTPPFGNDAGEITDIKGVSQESIWVTSNGDGAAQFRLAGREIVSMRSWGGSTQGGLSANNVRSIAVDQDGSIWFATSLGVFRYQPWAFQNIDDRMNSLPVHDLLFDRKGQLWVATGGEGVQVRADRYRQPSFYSPENSGLPGNVVYDLEEDEAGRIWAVTNRGVAYFDARRWHQPAALGDSDPAPLGILKADELGVWIGGAKGLLYYRFDDESVRIEPFLEGHSISAMEFDSLGRLWVASKDGAIWMRTIDGKWLDIDSFDTATASSAPVTAFFAEVEPPGSVLAAFKGYGVYRYVDWAWTNIDGSRRGSNDRIFTMMTNASSNSTWVGSESGLTRLDPYGSVAFDSQDGLQPGAIRAIIQDVDGAYWLGGDRGLFYYVPEQGEPWVNLVGVEGNDASANENGWQVLAGDPIEINFTYGDMQTSPAKLRTFVRLSNDEQAGMWQQLPGGVFRTLLPAVGAYTLEYRVRDQSLNYSPVSSMRLVAASAPEYMHAPFLGKVESRIFQLLVLFGFLAVFGFGYVSIEIVQHRRRVGDAVARGFNPYISGEPVRRDDMFFGRHELLQRIVSTLHNNSIMIHGERRIGKTTLLYQLANTLRQLDDPEYWFVALYVDLEGTTEDAFFHLLMDEIAQNVRALETLSEAQHQMLDALSHASTLATAYTDRAFSRDLRQIIQVLDTYSAEHKFGRQVRLILLMDEMDTLSQYNHLIQQQLRRIFMREFAASVGAVVAGIEISKDWERVESPWFNLFNEIPMTPFTRHEAIQLLVEPVRGYYIFEPDTIDFILQKSEGRPHRIQQYAMEAVNEMLRHKRRRIMMDDVLTAHEIIQWDSQAESIKPAPPTSEALAVTSSAPATM